MYKDPYLKAVGDIIGHLDRNTAILDAASDAIVEALLGGNALFTAEVGHANQHDWVNRAGGLAALRHFRFAISITDTLPKTLMDRPRPPEEAAMDAGLENVRHAVRISQLRAGDVILIGSVSGRNRVPVELALACRARGIRVIGFTSFAYTSQAVPLHPSGKRLKDVVDFPVDIGAPYGDAAVEIDGYDVPLLPVSGVGSTMAGWMIFERVMRKTAAQGKPAAVFMSVNREGGEEALKNTNDLCDARGF